MAPIEVYFGTLLLVFALVGWARGFLRELGVTTVMVLLLFFISTFEAQLDQGMVAALSVGERFVVTNSQDLFKCWVFVIVITVGAFISYAGETLAFEGQPPQGPQGIWLGILSGSLNGYLIAGSLWHYMHKFNYPIAWFGFAKDEMSAFAIECTNYLPIPFLGQKLFGISILLYLGMLLIIARVIR